MKVIVYLLLIDIKKILLFEYVLNYRKFEKFMEEIKLRKNINDFESFYCDNYLNLSLITFYMKFVFDIYGVLGSRERN
jgi:hypothetical protein